MEEITTAEAVFEALGGADGVASLTGSKPKAVLNWKYFGAFPRKTYLVMTEELRRRGKIAPASLWKMPESVS